MLTIFYRRFYILLFLVWLVAVAGLFVLSVWGNFDTFVNDFSRIVQMGAGNSTNGTDREPEVVQVVEKAGESIRREVVHEVRTLEKDINKAFVRNKTTLPPDPVKQDIKRDLAGNRTAAVSAHDSGTEGLGELTELDFTHTPEQFLARLKTTRKVGRVTYFWLDKPAKLVVDLRGKWGYSTRRVTDFIDGFVKQVVLGGHPDRLRVVFIFTDPKARRGKAPELIRTPEGLDILVDVPPDKQ